MSAPQLCPPCVHTLKELCDIGKDGRLCESFEGYTQTGDAKWVERAAEVAGPALLKTAKANLVRRGLLSPDA